MASLPSNCALCAAPLSLAHVVGTHGRGGVELVNVACATCGLVQQDPRPTQSDLDAWYASGDYRAQREAPAMRLPGGGFASHGTPEFVECRMALGRNRADTIVGMTGVTSGRALEIGCAEGNVGKVLIDLGFEVYGVEPDDDERKKALVMGIKAAKSLLRIEAAGIQPFDVVYSLHVVEHYADPIAELTRLRALVREGGMLFLECPNVLQPYGGLEYFFEKAHVYSFSPATLMATCMRAGWQPVRIVDNSASCFVACVKAEPQEATPRGQDGAWIAAHLREYQLSYEKQVRELRYADATARFLAGEDVDLGMLRSAVSVITQQGNQAVDAYDAAMRSIGDAIHDMDARVRLAEQFHEDPWMLGFVAGHSATCARVSQMLGHAGNKLRLAEYGAKADSPTDDGTADNPREGNGDSGDRASDAPEQVPRAPELASAVTGGDCTGKRRKPGRKGKKCGSKAKRKKKRAHRL